MARSVWRRQTQELRVASTSLPRRSHTPVSIAPHTECVLCSKCPATVRLRQAQLACHRELSRRMRFQDMPVLLWLPVSPSQLCGLVCPAAGRQALVLPDALRRLRSRCKWP